METLKGESNYSEWREEFDLQVGCLWVTLDRFLEEIRDDDEPITREKYDRVLAAPREDGSFIKPSDCNEADWDFGFASRQLYNVIFNHCDVDARKVIKEDINKCGFEAYRLLSREYDPVNSDTACNLLQSILVIGRWVLKGVHQE